MMTFTLRTTVKTGAYGLHGWKTTYREFATQELAQAAYDAPWAAGELGRDVVSKDAVRVEVVCKYKKRRVS